MTGLSTSFEGFDWDRGNWVKCQQHGVSIEEIETALRSGALLILPVTRLVDDEERLIATGTGGSGRHILCRVHGAATRQADAAAPDQRPVHAPEGGRHL